METADKLRQDVDMRFSFTKFYGDFRWEIPAVQTWQHDRNDLRARQMPVSIGHDNATLPTSSRRMIAQRYSLSQLSCSE